MNPKELIDRIASMPPIEVVAMVVRMARGLRQWKQETLADFARVSLTTVERIERAEPVSADSLDRVAQALGYDPGAFTAPRVPIPREEAAAQMIDQLGNLQQVKVRPFETHRQVRMVAAPRPISSIVPQRRRADPGVPRLEGGDHLAHPQALRSRRAQAPRHLRRQALPASRPRLSGSLVRRGGPVGKAVAGYRRRDQSNRNPKSPVVSSRSDSRGSMIAASRSMPSSNFSES